MLSVDEQKKVFLLYASKEVGYRDENRKGSREERRGRKKLNFTAESNIQSSPSRYVPIPVGVLPARGVPGGLPILCSTWWGGGGFFTSLGREAPGVAAATFRSSSRHTHGTFNPANAQACPRTD